MAKRQQGRPPKWTWPQIAGALFLLVGSIGMFVLQGLDRVLWGQDIDFGPLPWAILGVSVYVLYGLRLTGVQDKDE